METGNGEAMMGQEISCFMISFLTFSLFCLSNCCRRRWQLQKSNMIYVSASTYLGLENSGTVMPAFNSKVCNGQVNKNVIAFDDRRTPT